MKRSYIATKPFRDMDGLVKSVGDTVIADDDRAAHLRSVGLIGGAIKVETASVKAPEKATMKKPEPKEKRRR